MSVAAAAWSGWTQAPLSHIPSRAETRMSCATSRRTSRVSMSRRSCPGQGEPEGAKDSRGRGRLLGAYSRFRELRRLAGCQIDQQNALLRIAQQSQRPAYLALRIVGMRGDGQRLIARSKRLFRYRHCAASALPASWLLSAATTRWRRSFASAATLYSSGLPG